MHRILLFSLFFSFCAPALAVYKCESDGKVGYSETPCPDGQLLDLNTSVRDADAAQAKQQITADKKKLANMENTRHKREAIEERAARVQAAKYKKCAALAQRKKWALEDAASASGKSSAKARRNAQRLSEKYELECG